MQMGDGWRGPLNKIDGFRYEIPRSYKPAMRTNGIIFIDEPMVAQLRQDQAPEQVANVATMPGILGNAMAMPDIHWGTDSRSAESRHLTTTKASSHPAESVTT